MNKIFSVFFFMSMLTASSVRGDISFPIEGAVDDVCVAAVPTHLLHLYTTPEREDALMCELRICDDQGRNVPFALRQRKTVVVEKHKKWHTLTVTRVATSNDALIVEAELPANTNAQSRWVAFDVHTPLKDFEQTVRIFADGQRVGDGTICDYGKYADFRRTKMPVDCAFARRFTFVFAKPVSSAEAARFERTITERADGTLAAQEIRRSVTERPFRIDGIRVAEEITETRLKPPQSFTLAVPAEIERDARAKKTRLTVATRGLPITMIGINTPEENFRRDVRVSRRRNNGWEVIAKGELHVVSLPGENRMSLSIGLNSEVRESMLQIEIDDGDRPPLTFDRLPVTLWATPYDAVFIAHPKRRYSIAIENGAARQPADEVGIAYLAAGREPVQLVYSATGSWETPVDVSEFKKWNPLPTVSVIVFVVLGFVCLRLFRSTREAA